jgi:hypothetical protein
MPKNKSADSNLTHPPGKNNRENTHFLPYVNDMGENTYIFQVRKINTLPMGNLNGSS